MSEQSMINALRKLRESTFRNKTARLRDLYDEVEALRSSGFSHKQIVATMKEQGLIFGDVKTFEVTFYRIKKERNIGRVTTRASESLAPDSTIASESKMATSTLSAFKNAVKTISPPASSNDETRNKLRELGGLNPNEYNPIPDRKPEF